MNSYCDITQGRLANMLAHVHTKTSQIRTNITLFLSLPLVIGVGTFACSHSDDYFTVLDPPAFDSRILLDHSFERNGSPTLEGWTVPDTSLVHFSTDVPPDGGSFSVVILGLSGRAGWLTWTMPAAEGINHLRFSWWSKHTSAVSPLVTLGLKNGQRVDVAHSFSMVNDTLWTSYSVLDTLTAGPGDSLLVRIAGAGSEVTEGETSYDLVTLRRFN